MTTIITRLYPDLATATSVAANLAQGGHDPSTIEVVTRVGNGTVAARMQVARVPGGSAAVYAPQVEKGAALLVVRAPFAPMGTALHAKRVVNRTPSIDVGLADEDHYVREQPNVEIAGKVMSGTVFFMSNPHRPTSHAHILGRNPILPSKPRTSAISGGGYMSTKVWPMKLLSAPKERTSAARGGFLVSAIFGIPTLMGDLPSRELLKTTL